MEITEKKTFTLKANANGKLTQKGILEKENWRTFSTEIEVTSQEEADKYEEWDYAKVNQYLGIEEDEIVKEEIEEDIH